MDAPVLISAPRMAPLDASMPGADDAPRHRANENLMPSANDVPGHQATNHLIGIADASVSASRRLQCTRASSPVFSSSV